MMVSSLYAIDIGRKSVIVDSNLLLLLVVGLWNPRAIKEHKRLSDLTHDDFEVLRAFLGTFGRVVTTAHVLTEVSNLAGSAHGQAKAAIFRQLESLISVLDERNLPASSICSRPEFFPFGLTDAVLSHFSGEMLLITKDGRLARHLQTQGLNALTLENIKSLRNTANNA
jgi:rRNA-processing protein FCF1